MPESISTCQNTYLETNRNFGISNQNFEFGSRRLDLNFGSFWKFYSFNWKLKPASGFECQKIKLKNQNFGIRLTNIIGLGKILKYKVQLPAVQYHF